MLTKKDADKIKKKARNGQYRDALQALAEAKGEEITPYDVLKEAQDVNSSLHSAFSWDDSEAAEKYRLMEARMLLNSVKVEFMGQKRPAYFNTRVVVRGEMRQAYFPVERVMNDEDIHKAVLRDAVRDLKHAQEKYKQITELEGVINEKKLKKAEQIANA